MEVRKIELTLDECSEVRVLLSRKFEDLNQKCSQFSRSDKSVDKKLFSYWYTKLCTLKSIYRKLCRNPSEVVS